MRKFSISVTLATQTINAFNEDVRKEIPALCRLLLMFRVDMESAKAFTYLFNVDDKNIYTLPLHSTSINKVR